MQEVNEKKNNIAKPNANMHLLEDLLCKYFKVAPKALRVFKANPQLKRQPSFCCIARTAFAKGNWARSSSL